MLQVSQQEGSVDVANGFGGREVVGLGFAIPIQ